ncbi:hypothetical protein SRB5_07800 [Streptomyces sp. RB5]|uniref:Uncharacterized protein n=1 Tax=Streptomyces smaragdinus TaxID=2585196 RepID=A0A7K0CB66_9ACTN|nr:hypothetical protein [Streptomyces smaragdinus]MQY10668.1 hypothetical protein [Streptomyces smaragdinus]
MTRPREIGYTDELLADRSVHRTYEDGRREWRRRGADGVVHWRDDQGGTGTDELLGARIIKRVLADGTATYGRDLGYGRTLWSRSETLMVNRTSFGGRMGAILAGIGVLGVAVTASQMPPLHLTPEEEEELRRQARTSSDGGGDVEAGGDDWGGGDWGDDDGGWSDDDFG